MADPVDTFTHKLQLDGIGSALKLLEGASLFGAKVTVDKGDLMYVPDPDNDNNSVVWVQNAGNAGDTVTVTFAYAAE